MQIQRTPQVIGILNPDTMPMLLQACADPRACFILGAGASWPHVPTTGAMPDRFKRFAPYVSSFPAAPLRDVPIRRLMDPIAERMLRTLDQLDDWKMLHWTADTIAVALEQIIAAAHTQRPPQYGVFRLFPASAAVISFNWDGLAKRFCPQAVVKHPHGYILPRTRSDLELDDVMWRTQMNEASDGKWWFQNTLVMIGEESGDATRSAREEVFDIWRQAPTIVIVGYTFGFGSHLDYDRIWRELFIEAMRLNPAPIHILAPEPEDLRLAVQESIGRSTDVVSWAVSWHSFAQALIRVSRRTGLVDIGQLLSLGPQIFGEYEATLHAHAAA